MIVSNTTNVYHSIVGSPSLSCPETDKDHAGICIEECSVDVECDDGHKCCSNGCGHSCVKGVPVPYSEPPLQCPSYIPSTNCTKNCHNDSSCDERELCCSTGWCMACVEGEVPAPLCSAVREAAISNPALVYTPQCEKDGSFTPVQCYASIGYCWCVHTQTGEPLSDLLKSTKPICTSKFYIMYTLHKSLVISNPQTAATMEKYILLVRASWLVIVATAG